MAKFNVKLIVNKVSGNHFQFNDNWEVHQKYWQYQIRLYQKSSSFQVKSKSYLKITGLSYKLEQDVLTLVTTHLSDYWLSE